MKELTLAVISDVHVGRAAREQDICPPDILPAKPDSKFLGRFLELLHDKSIVADYLLLPGDVTDSAAPNEAGHASVLIRTIAKGLRMPLKRCAFVPGNHDVDWLVLKEPDPTGVRRQQRYDTLKHTKFCFRRIDGNATGSVFSAPHFSVWDHDDAVIVGYNSAHHDDCHASTHYGLASREDLAQLRVTLGKCYRDSDRLRVFLVHHHPVDYAAPIANEPEFSAMQYAEELLIILQEFQFDLLIHGHKHSPRFHTYSRDGNKALGVLAAGSFSVELDPRWTGAVNNQFHVIRVKGRDPQDGCIQGVVESWTYTFARGWEPSDCRHSGIAHVEAFGTYLMPHRIQEKMRPIIAASLQEKGHVEGLAIIAVIPELRHCRGESVRQALLALEGEIGFTSYGGTDLKDKVLVKR